MLKYKDFDSKFELIDWANSTDGTDYIISILFENNKWLIFYIID